MLSFRKGTGGTPKAAASRAEYYGEKEAASVSIADYYLRGMVRAETEGAAAVPRDRMSVRVAEQLGIDSSRTLRQDEVTNLLLGLRADGEAIEGKTPARKVPGRDTITYYDFTFSAPKSVSVAMALAPTDAERHIIIGAHRDAVAAAMDHLESIVAYARKNAGPAARGEIGYWTYDHYTARPAVEIAATEADGTPTTLIQTVYNPAIKADMQLHTHAITPNIVAAFDGSVGALDTLALQERVKEVGAYYQAHLVTNLRAVGVDAGLDVEARAGRLWAVPQDINRMFSKRHLEGEEAAREYLKGLGMDWDAMAPDQIVGLLRLGSRRTRRDKAAGAGGDASGDFADWKAQAEAAGYRHESVINRGARPDLPETEQGRLRRGYDAALPVLDREFYNRSVVNGTVARWAAAVGLIDSGVERASDIDRITAAMREHGVQHDGKQVPLIWGELAATDEGAVDGRRRRMKITTPTHLAQEKELMALVQKAAADPAGALTPAAIERAVQHVERTYDLSFSDEHGTMQRQVIDALGTSGRFASAIGVAGAGKSTLLTPLVHAYRYPPEGKGREVYGVSLGWKQSRPLADAGIKRGNAMAIDAFLFRAEMGWLKLSPDTVVIVDEMSQVGTAKALAIAKLREAHGFTVRTIGDDRQGQAIEAGSGMALIAKALGTERIPKIESSIRQTEPRDRDTALLFRAGKADEGIERLHEDGRLVVTPGGRTQTIEAIAEHWERRIRANADRPDYRLTIDTPTNHDARAVNAAIRHRRRRLGQLGPDVRTLQAVDQNGAEYALPLAVGDRVRLFAKTKGAVRYASDVRNIGDNGSVVTVEQVWETGLQLRNDRGTSALVPWSELTEERTGRVKLTYGDVISTDAIQSATSTEHFHTMPSGSVATQGFKAYVGESRAREATWMFVSDGLERTEISGKRALGNVEPITPQDVLRNVAVNLSRQPEKELATDLMDNAISIHRGSVRSLAGAFQATRQTARAPQATTFRQARDAAEVVVGAADVAAAATRAADGVARAVSAPEVRQAVREARRSMRGPAQRPKRVKQAPAPITDTEAQTEFAVALRSAGLQVKGAPEMDGKMHRVPVEGDKRGRRSGSYLGYLDGVPAGYIHNFKTGQQERWSSKRATRPMSADERARFSATVAAQQAQRQGERDLAESKAAGRARGMWNRAKPAQAHPYLVEKGVAAHGARVDRRGNLLIPMRDAAGTLWSLQTIRAETDSGQPRKTYLKGGRRAGTHALLGELRGDGPLIIAEGFATAATLREATGLPVAVAFDSGNLAAVAAAYRKLSGDRTIILAGDNDHHLPRQTPPLPNVGAVTATAAAEAVGGVPLLPSFGSGETGTDWNDVAATKGLAAVRVQIGAHLTPLGVELAAWSGGRPSQAARDTARRQTETRTGRAAGSDRRSPEREPPGL